MSRFAPTVLLILFLLSGCSEDRIVDPPPPELPDSLYYTIEDGPPGTGFLVGWARLPGDHSSPISEWKAETFLPGQPWRQRIEWLGGGRALHWEVGPDVDGPFQRGAYVPHGLTQGYAFSGWGELNLDPMIIPTDTEIPLALFPQSPLGLAELGLEWDAAGRPATLERDVMLFPAPELAPLWLQAALSHEGQVEEGRLLESFSLALGGDTVYFKLRSEQFPVPEAIYWEGTTTYLHYWGEIAPNIADQAFAPQWPAPDGYVASVLDIPLAGGGLPASRFRPEGDGPFPALLLVADDGLADRNDAAAFGHLAHACARAGFLVLRYDKPGTGASPAGPDSLDLRARRAAIAAAWQALREDADADPLRTLLLGHGEGGALALEFAADEQTVAGVLALSPLLYDPTQLPVIPEAANAPGDWIESVGGTLFVGKYKDLTSFDSADYLSAAGWADRRVYLARAEADPRLSAAALQDQQSALEAAGAWVTVESFALTNRYLTTGRADAAPSAELVAGLLDWLEGFLPLAQEQD